MNYRTDLQYVNGNLVASNANSADVRVKLPEVKLTDRLASSSWGETVKAELKPYGLDSEVNISAALHAQQQISDTAKRYTLRRNKQSPEDTQYKHLKRLASDYQQAFTNIANETDRARSGLQKRKQQIQTEFEMSMKFDMRDAGDIRKALREIPQEERNEHIMKAIESGDGNLLGVILNSHPITTGITNEAQNAYRANAMRKHRPDLLALETNINKVDDLLFGAFNDLLSIEDTLTAKAIREKYDAEHRAAQEVNSI